MWNLAIKKLGIPLLSKPSKAFVQYVISKLYSDTVKTSEKITKEHFAKCFGQGLEEIYGIPIHK